MMKMECKKCNLMFVNSFSLKKHNDLFCKMEHNVEEDKDNFPLSLVHLVNLRYLIYIYYKLCGRRLESPFLTHVG